MIGLQLRTPSRSESRLTCTVCDHPPARVLTITDDRKHSVVTRLCAVHYEDLVRLACNLQLTYGERVAHGVTKEEA